MTFGLTDTGYIIKTLEDILAEIEADLKDTVSPTIDVSISGPVGQLNSIFGDKVRELWAMAQSVYRSRHPDYASGEALDALAALTGAIRLPATKSTVTLNQLWLDPGTTIPVGAVVSVGTNGARFVVTAAVTNSTAYKATFSTTAEAETAGIVQGYARTIDTIQSAVSGWSAAAAVTCTGSAPFTLDGYGITVAVDGGSAQPVSFAAGNPWSAADVASQINSATSGVDAYAVGNQVRVASLTEGTGSSIQITMDAGITAALGFPPTLIQGFNSTDATVGTNIETDPELRVRREELLRASGKGTLEAIISDVRAVSGVDSATGIENVTSSTDPLTGLPGHSFEIIITGAATSAEQQAVAEAIWESKPAGIESYGNDSKTVTDSEGNTHEIYFTIATAVPIYISAVISTLEGYPADGDDQVKAALAAEVNGLGVGLDVVVSRIKSAIFDVTGVHDVTTFLIDDIDPPVGSSNIVIGAKEYASCDTSDISVSSGGAPST